MRPHEWVMAHIWKSHVTRMIESCHTYEWVTSHIRMSHVTHTNESRHTNGGIPWCFLIMYKSRHTLCMSHVPPTNEMSNKQIWMSHVTPTNAAWHVYQMKYVARMEESIESCSLSNEACYTYEWGTSSLLMSHATHTNESCHTYDCVMAHTWMSHVTSTNELGTCQVL